MGRWLACTWDSRVAAVGVLSFMSCGNEAGTSFVKDKELRFEPVLELTPSESSSSSSSERSSLRVDDSACSCAKRAALTED